MKIMTHTDLGGQTCRVVFSEDMTRRFDVTWVWAPGPILTFCLLNPSTLDHQTMDPTGMGVINRGRRWGFGGARIVNAFTIRTPRPNEMLRHHDPVGRHADKFLTMAMQDSFNDGSPFICGWGPKGKHRTRDLVIRAMAAQMGLPLMALAINQDGTPQHPLYIAHEQRPFVWKEDA